MYETENGSINGVHTNRVAQKLILAERDTKEIS